MPHATLPSPGFQAIILCGPGASLDTFTSNLEEFPKALVPIANKPMVWYPIEFCSRMGITGKTSSEYAHNRSQLISTGYYTHHPSKSAESHTGSTRPEPKLRLVTACRDMFAARLKREHRHSRDLQVEGSASRHHRRFHCATMRFSM